MADSLKFKLKPAPIRTTKKKNYNSGYVYSINRRSRITKNNKVFHYYENYHEFDCDIFAFVQPRLYKIAFFHVDQIDVKYRKVLKPDQFEEYSIDEALTYIKEKS